MRVFAKSGIVIMAAFIASFGYKGRIAIAQDGNTRDKDDIGASAWAQAIIKKGGAKLVHHHYNHMLCQNNPSQAKEMRTSVRGAASRFFGTTSFTYDILTQSSAAKSDMVKQINASSSSSPLKYLMFGRMEVPWQHIMASSSSKRKYVTAISHSKINDNFTAKCMTHTWADIKRTGVKTIHISDQNTNLRVTTASRWAWAKNSSNANIRWLYSRMEAGVFGDISDAGLAWYAIKGDQNGTPEKLKAFFGNILPKQGLMEESTVASGMLFPEQLEMSALQTRGNNNVQFSLALPESGPFTLSVFDIQGQRLFHDQRNGDAGYQTIDWNMMESRPTGMLIAVLQQGNMRVSKNLRMKQ